MSAAAGGGVGGGALALALREQRYEAAALRLALGVLEALARAAGDAPGTREQLISLLAVEEA